MSNAEVPAEAGSRRQTLFPRLGKISARISKAWKNGGKFFQALETVTARYARRRRPPCPGEV
jgi:hypothetical protein